MSFLPTDGGMNLSASSAGNTFCVEQTSDNGTAQDECMHFLANKGKVLASTVEVR